MKVYKIALSTLLAGLLFVSSGCQSSGGDETQSSGDSSQNQNGNSNENVVIDGNGENYIITDKTTGLMWQDSQENEKDSERKNWDEANAYCENLKYKGYDDWYLPSASEFQTLQWNNLSDSFHYRGDEFWTRSTTMLKSNYYDDKSSGYIKISGDWADKNSISDENNVRCVRGRAPLDVKLYGHWAFVDSGMTFDIDATTFFKEYKVIDNNQIQVTDDEGKKHYLIRAGIADVAIEGEIAQVQGDESKSLLGKIKSATVTLKNKVTQTKKQIKLVKTDVKEKVGQVKDDKAKIKEIYAEATKDGTRLKIPKNKYFTMPTGQTLIDIEDDLKNKASFVVSLLGEQTDVGVMSVTNQKYNFKSFLDNQNDWIYFGYNDGEEKVSYTKRLNICNIGTQSISGVSFKIELDSNASDINRTFSTKYDGSAIGFEKDECKQYDISFAFKRPQKERDVKINITITNNNNGLQWYDYASLKVSPYKPLKLYFLSNQKELNGFLVAPGRQLIGVTFKGDIYYGKDNFVRVPLQRDKSYDVVISTPTIGNEDVYMITSGKEPDTTKMDGFTAVKNYEPNNQEVNATKIPLLQGEAVSYLSVGDIDFYRLTDIPFLTTKAVHINKAMSIKAVANTELNSSTLNGIELVNSSGEKVDATVSLQENKKTVIVTPKDTLQSQTYSLVTKTTLQSVTGYSLAKEQNIPVHAYTTHIKKIILDENQESPGVDEWFEYNATSGITTDFATGLMWQDNSDVKDMNWSDANTTCSNLELGGYDDWRLPHINELVQAVTVTKNEYGDTTTKAIFTNGAENEYFWSDSIQDNARRYVQSSLEFYSQSDGADSKYATRCVRGDDENNLTRDDDKKIVIDYVNNLVWEDDANVTGTYDDAKTHCSNLELGGYDDWRVPTLFELETIYDYNGVDVNVSGAFKYFANRHYYWSSTKNYWDQESNFAMYGSESSSTHQHSNSSYIRCVRGGE